MATSEQPLNTSLYVGDLAPEVSETLLFDIFNAVGPVASIRVCRDAITKRSLGYAYVNFHNVTDAERALDSMNYSQIANRTCRIMWSQRDPTVRRSGVGNIFIKHLAKSVDHKELFETFSMFGNILSCKVAYSLEGESLGYGFVHFETEQAAQKAIENVNGMIMAGSKVHVAPFIPKSERESADSAIFTNIYVKNIPESFTQEKFEELFSKFGTVTSSMLSYDESGKFRGFGFVNLEKPEAAAAAIKELNEKEFEGKILYVGRAMKKSERLKILRERFEKMKLEKEKMWAGCNLYVKNLAENVDEERLRQEFSPYGEISSARIMVDPAGRSRGFGFVCFTNQEDAGKALQDMGGKVIEKKPLYVGYAQRKDVRVAQLQAQFAHRRKMIQMHPMYPPTPAMYYPGQQPPTRQNFVYSPQTMAPNRRINVPGAPAGVPRGPMTHMYNIPPSAGRMPRGGRANRGRVNPGNKNYPNRAIPRDMNAAPVSMPQDPRSSLLQVLAAASPQDQKQMIGERLFPLIKQLESTRAGKITGMLLEMDNSDLLELLESPQDLEAKVREAVDVLVAHEKSASEGAIGTPVVSA